jgi:hypothetical protein
MICHLIEHALDSLLDEERRGFGVLRVHQPHLQATHASVALAQRVGGLEQRV